MLGIQQGTNVPGYTEKLPKTTTAATSTTLGANLTKPTPSAPPVRLGELVTFQPLLQRTAHGCDSLHTDSSDDHSLSPLPPPPGGRTPPHSFPLSRHGNDRASEAERAAERAMLMMMPTTSPAQPKHANPNAPSTAGGSSVRENVANRMSTETHRDDCDEQDGDADVVATLVAGGARDGHSGSPVTRGDKTNNPRADFARGGGSDKASAPTKEETDGQTDTKERTSASPEQRHMSDMNQQEEQGRDSNDESSEERAASLPSSSVLATDGSGELGRRSVRWRSVGPVPPGGGGDDDGKGAADGRGTVWSKRCARASKGG